MRNKLILSFVLLLASGVASAQFYITKTGVIRFVSEAKVEKIEAVNNQVNAILNPATAEFGFKLLIKSFEFEKALMQEHFNENYLESDKFPLSTFVGKVTNIKEINLSKDGTYTANVEGDLTIHGVTNKVKQAGTFTVKTDKIIANANFDVPLKDYKIVIPSAVFNKVASSVKVTINVTLEKTK